MYGLPHGVYKLVVDKKKYHSLIRHSVQRFPVPPKIYGDINERIATVIRSYKERTGSTGVLCTGFAGSGKTLLCEQLCNAGLDINLRVILVSEIDPSIETIQYLSALTNCLIFIDEFGKVFNRWLQSNMLTMLSSSTTKNIYVLSDNDTLSIDPHILNRPARIRYHFEYGTLDEDIVIEYCNDNNVDPEIIKSILTVRNSAISFAFDHLQAIVSEHKVYPEHSIDTLLNSLNLSVLRAEKQLVVKSIFNIKEPKTNYEAELNMFSSNKILLSKLKKGGYINITLRTVVEPTEKGVPTMPVHTSLRVSSKDITSISDEEITMTVDNFIITFDIVQ